AHEAGAVLVTGRDRPARRRLLAHDGGPSGARQSRDPRRRWFHSPRNPRDQRRGSGSAVSRAEEDPEPHGPFPAPHPEQELLHEHEHPDRGGRSPGRHVSFRVRPRLLGARPELQGARAGQPVRRGHQLLSEHRSGQSRAHGDGQRDPGRRAHPRAHEVADRSTSDRETKGIEIMSLKEKVAIVTGGNSGIGKAIVLSLAEQGAKLVIDYVCHPEATEELERQGAPLANRAIGVAADVSKVDELQTLVDSAVKTFGRLDVMVNNAGVETRTGILDTTEKQYEFVLNVNLKSAFFGTQLAAKQMIAQGDGGRIINITSVHEDWPMPGNLPYCLSKGG